MLVLLQPLIWVTQAPRTAQSILGNIFHLAQLIARNKQTVGQRLANVALSEVYGKPTTYNYPRYQQSTARYGLDAADFQTLPLHLTM